MNILGSPAFSSLSLFSIGIAVDGPPVLFNGRRNNLGSALCASSHTTVKILLVRLMLIKCYSTSWVKSDTRSLLRASFHTSQLDNFHT